MGDGEASCAAGGCLDVLDRPEAGAEDVVGVFGGPFGLVGSPGKLAHGDLLVSGVVGHGEEPATDPESGGGLVAIGAWGGPSRLGDGGHNAVRVRSWPRTEPAKYQGSSATSTSNAGMMPIASTELTLPTIVRLIGVRW